MEHVADIGDANGAAQYYNTAEQSYGTVDQYYSAEQPAYGEGRLFVYAIGHVYTKSR